MELTKMSETEVTHGLGKKRGPSRSSVHLWEFLLELLADDRFSSLITWTRKEQGEFKLRNQEEVAKRWGKLKQRPGMNYDKLSRALRYYYQKNIIKKVSGQRLVYKFVDLPYSYKPVKNLYETGFQERKEDQDQLALKCPKSKSEMFRAFSHPDRSRPNFVITSTSPNFGVVQQPITSRPTSHVTLASNGVCFPIVDRSAKHISVPVIMKCGQASELPRCPVYLKPGTIFADGNSAF